MNDDVRIGVAPAETLGAFSERKLELDPLERNDDELARKLPPPMRPPLLAASAASGALNTHVNANANASADVPIALTNRCAADSAPAFAPVPLASAPERARDAPERALSPSRAAARTTTERRRSRTGAITPSDDEAMKTPAR